MTEIVFNQWVWGWMALALVSFIGLQFVDAPYGRHTTRKWGTLMPNRIGWLLMELPAFLICPLIYLFGKELNVVGNFLILLWCLHYFHRTIIFPFQTKTAGKKMPLAIVLMAVFFNGGNGFFNGYWFANFNTFTAETLTESRFMFGILLFALGMAINMYSDYRLIALRKPGETGYKIPYGGLFRYVSCPNHLGEIIEWLGFAIAADSLPAWSFFVWTLANLVPRALSHHRWYKSVFDDYPSSRKAVFPGLF